MILTNPIWGKLHTISASRINAYIRCGIKFQYEYVYEMKPPGNLNMYRGLALHKAIEVDNKHFMINDTRLGHDVLKSIAIEHFEENLKKGVFIPKRDINKQEQLISEAKNQMLLAIRLYVDMEKPWIPDTVEENVIINIGYPLPAVIRIDLIDNMHSIWDWKTMGKDKNLVSSVQDLIYSKYYEQEYKVRPSFKYVKFVLTKKNPYVEIQELESVKNYNKLDKYMEAYFNGIENNVFLPASDTDYCCSEGACPFYLNCDFRGINLA